MHNSKRTSLGFKITAVCSLVYFASYFARKDFAATLAGMVTSGALDKTTGGLIGTALFICYGVGQLLFGYLADKIKPWILIVTGLSLSGISNVLMPLVPDTALMIPLWAVNGFAQAMLWPPIVRMLADELDSEKFVKANLYVTSAAHVSTILLYLYVPMCLTFFDWKTVFFTAGILAIATMLIFTVCMWKTVTEGGVARKSDVKKSDTGHSESFISIMNRAGIWFVLIGIIMMGFLRDGIESWLPTLYAEVFNRDASESVLFSAILPVFSILSIMLATALHKLPLFNNEASGTLVFFLIAAGVSLPISLLMTLDAAWARIICLVLCALITAAMHAVNFLYISCMPGRFKRMGRAATASGVCNACTYIGAAISMYGIAAIAESSSWSVTVIVWAVIAAVGALTSLLALPKFKRFIK